MTESVQIAAMGFSAGVIAIYLIARACIICNAKSEHQGTERERIEYSHRVAIARIEKGLDDETEAAGQEE